MAWFLLRSPEENNRAQAAKLYENSRVYKDYVLSFCFGSRFSNDKKLIDNDNMLFIIDGVIFNSEDTFWRIENSGAPLLKKDAVDIINRARGIFSGCWIDKKSEKAIVFGNQTGDSPVFYYNDEEMLCASSDFNMVISACRSLGRTFHLNPVAVNHLMSLGYIVERNTIAKEVKKLDPGEALFYETGTLNVFRYHSFKTGRKSGASFEEAIEQLDEEFDKAVRRGMEKDLEGGYSNHLVNLSAGLDCKMISFAARKMGYKDITNNCYAKGYSDEIQYVLATEKVLKNDLIFMPLDPMLYALDLEEMVRKNFGLSIYAGSTQCNRMLSSLNFSRFGLEFNGMLGDVVIGTFIKDPKNTEPNVDSILYSRKVAPLLNRLDEWQDHELFAMYYRGFQGAVSSHLIRNTHTVTYSPFLDVDFMQFCLDLSLEYRCGHKLYWKWIYSKYPEIVDIPTTTYNPYKAGVSKRKLSRVINPKLRAKIISRLQDSGMIKYFTGANTMKPQDEMIKGNPDVSVFMDNYFNENLGRLSAYPEIVSGLKELYNGPVIEKELALTVICAAKIYRLD